MNVLLFSTPHCHLCEMAETLLNSMDTVTDIHKVDIATSEEMVEEYGVRIPVLRIAPGYELDWPFDAQKVQQFLDAAS